VKRRNSVRALRLNRSTNQVLIFLDPEFWQRLGDAPPGFANPMGLRELGEIDISIKSKTDRIDTTRIPITRDLRRIQNARLKIEQEGVRCRDGALAHRIQGPVPSLIGESSTSSDSRCRSV